MNAIVPSRRRRGVGGGVVVVVRARPRARRRDVALHLVVVAPLLLLLLLFGSPVAARPPTREARAVVSAFAPASPPSTSSSSLARRRRRRRPPMPRNGPTRPTTTTAFRAANFAPATTTRPLTTTSRASSTTTTSEGGAAPPVDLRHAEYGSSISSSSSSDDESSDGGPPPLPPAIFLHGLLGSKRNFASLASSLSSQLARKRRILSVDLRNHGDNVHDWRDDMSYGSMASDVLALLDREGFDEAVLVGHSMGGKVAQALALLHPHRVAGLVVLDIAPVRYCPSGDASWAAVKEIVDAMRDVELGPGTTKRDVDSSLRSVVEDPALRAFVLTNLGRRGTDDGGAAEEEELKWKINVDAVSSQLDSLAGFDVDPPPPASSSSDSDRSAKRKLVYEGDSFFIHGGQSRFVRHRHMETIADYFPNHMLTTIRGVGHWVHAEAPDDTLALVKRYLDR